MKLFNVHLEVKMTEIGDPETTKSRSEMVPLTEGFAKDSPIKDVGTLIERLQERGMFPGASAPFPVLAYGEDREGMNMRHDFQVTIGSFQDMQEILAKFRHVAESMCMPVDSPNATTT